EAILVELPEVAGVEPAVGVERRACRRFVLPVALEDVRSVRDDLAVLGDLHLDAGKRDADRSETVPVQSVEREGRGALGEPVALEDLDAELAPGLAERGVEGGAARDDVAELASELRVDLEEEHSAKRHREPS